MSINGSSPNLLLQVSLCNTPDPTVCRMLSVSSQMTFTELHEAIAVAFGWNIEPCASWVFKKQIRNRVNAPEENNFIPFWTAPGQECNAVPNHRGTQVAIGLCMENESSRRYWTYDYNISYERHAIRVVDILTAGSAPKVACVGGFGHINRKLWQLASLIGHGNQVTTEQCTGVIDFAAMNVKLGEIQARFEERKRVEAIPPTVPKDNPKKRAAPSESESESANAHEVKVARGENAKD